MSIKYEPGYYNIFDRMREHLKKVTDEAMGICDKMEKIKELEKRVKRLEKTCYDDEPYIKELKEIFDTNVNTIEYTNYHQRYITITSQYGFNGEEMVDFCKFILDNNLSFFVEKRNDDIVLSIKIN